MKKILSYLKVAARVEIRQQLVFRTNFFLGIIMIVLRVLILIALWNALYIGKDLVDGIDLPTMRFYTVASIILEILISANIERGVSEKVKDGSIALMINRPISYPGSVVLDQLAFTAQNFLLRIVPYTLILLVSGIAFKAKVCLNLMFFASVLMSYLLMLFYQMFFGFVSFWTQEISGLLEARDVLLTVLSGSMIPLWFFPDWLRSVSYFLPFQAFYSTPLSILIGRLDGQEALWNILIQGAWLILFAVLTAVFWHKARKRVFVNGG